MIRPKRFNFFFISIRSEEYFILEDSSYTNAIPILNLLSKRFSKFCSSIKILFSYVLTSKTELSISCALSLNLTPFYQAFSSYVAISLINSILSL